MGWLVQILEAEVGALQREKHCVSDHVLPEFYDKSKRSMIWAFIHTPSLGYGLAMVSACLKLQRQVCWLILCHLDTS